MKKSKAARPTLDSTSQIGIINRGEAAIRFIRAVREYNTLYDTALTTVAFYIDIERESLFVKEADAAYPLPGKPVPGGPVPGEPVPGEPVSQASLSHMPGSAKNQGSATRRACYLNRELMLEALISAHCQAVWVGWGFLAEDAAFARMIEEAGLVFLGPSAESMALLGNKISAKELAERAKVPILPWSKGPVKDVEEARLVAEKIGYPVIVKAANAGGGRGIRFVMKPEELTAQYLSAQEEAMRTAGNDIMFIEHLVVTGRHLEVQVLADRYGNVSTFGVRDCSVQRRNQKIIEETPPPHLDQLMITEVQEAAARLIREADYESAGTVEFLYDVDDGRFYFMEVNTRLQVEHPITEQLYQIDLVKGQIQIARGQKLEQSSHDPTGAPGRGVAIEVRLNAEDPDRDFIPAPGKVVFFKIPAGPGIRVDSGIEQGSVIPSEFDSMIAKIIAYAPDRNEALARLKRALKEMRIKVEGGTSNRAFLLGLLDCPQIRRGGVSTRFVGDLLKGQKQVIRRDNWDIALMACAIEQAISRCLEEMRNFKQQWSRIGQPRDISSSRGCEVTLNVHGHTYLFLVKALENNVFHLKIDHQVSQERLTQERLLVVQYLKRDHEALLLHGRKRYTIQIVPRDDIVQCEVDGIPYPIEIESSDFIKAPFPAIVISVAVKPGQIVQKGDLLLELEAMKMVMSMEAHKSGLVKAICIREGEQVAAGQQLIQMDDNEQQACLVQACPAQACPAQACLVAEAKEEEECSTSQPRICFDRQPATPEPGKPVDMDDIACQWQIMEREFLAIFLGYDYDHEEDATTRRACKIMDRMLDLVIENPYLQKEIVKSFLAVLEIYAAVENLFSHHQIESDGFAGATSYQELFMHFFIRNECQKKGLPQQFLDSLDRAIKWYPNEGLNEEAGLPGKRFNRALFRIYKSHANLKTKQEVLRSTLYSMKGLPDIKLFGQKVSDLLDEIAQLTQDQMPSLADAAIQARYHLIDSIFLEKMKEERRKQLEELSLLSGKTDPDRQSRSKLIKDIVNTGSYIVFDLVRLALDKDKDKRKLALELLGKRFNRDRKFISGSIKEKDELLLYHMYSAREKQAYLAHTHPVQDHPVQDHETIVVVVDDKSCAKKMEEIQNYLNETEAETNPELILLVSVEAAQDEQKGESLIHYLYRQSLPVCWCCLGLFYKPNVTSYHTLTLDQEQKWQEDLLRGPFNPLFYRELKVYILANFSLKVLYSSESVYLVSAIAKNNPKDKRLFALVEVPESRAEVSEDDSIQRIVAFDYALMEAIYVMSAEQSKDKHRLFLNRIIIHVNSVLSVNLRQAKEYASRLSSHARELGLEKVIVLAHREKTGSPGRGEKTIGEKTIVDLELHFKNISKDHFTMDPRTPSMKLLEPMTDNYVSKVVQAIQRGAIYPYEIVKMITHMELGNSDGRSDVGNFEEFDIRVTAGTDSQETFSVKARPYGRNRSNIVFGIITNYTKSHTLGLNRLAWQRVIILVDTTSDMGSLAEEECRRIIGALDLAEKEQLPIEWLPISGGAKIDMTSGTENLDWTARVLKRIIEFTQAGGEINIIVSGVNVGAQSYWNAEATMLMHTKGILIMTEDASMLLTGKKALDFSGSVSAENNIGIGGVEKIMGPNGQAQIRVKNLSEAYTVLFQHYNFTYREPGNIFPRRQTTADKYDRDVSLYPYNDRLGQGFSCIGDIFSQKFNPERKKPFDMRQVMLSVIDQDYGFLERWQIMKNAETAIVWETRSGGYSIGMLGIESRPLARLGKIPHDGPESWSGGTLFPQSSKKLSRAINAFSHHLPLVILANLSGFDGSPESLRKLQLEFGAEIGRAIVNFKGPIIFVVVARYHGGAYVVFSRTLNPLLHAVALQGTYASVIGGAPAAAVIFSRNVLKDTYADPRIIEAQNHLKDNNGVSQKDFDDLFQKVRSEKQTALAQQFDQIHSVERAKKVGSIDEIISPRQLRPYLIKSIEEGMAKYCI